MNFKRIALIIALISFQAMAGSLIISEVFANGPGNVRDGGQEWFEIYNASFEAISLDGVVVRRLDFAKKLEAFVITLQTDIIVPPLSYAVIAQKRDLGIGICMDVPLVVLEDSAFRLKNMGVQTLCVTMQDGTEDCALFSNATPFPDGRSRALSVTDAGANDKITGWALEDCKLMDGIFASPGFSTGACHHDVSMWERAVVPCSLEEMVKTPEPAVKIVNAHMPKIVAAHTELIGNGKIKLVAEAEDLDDDDKLDVRWYYSDKQNMQQGTLIGRPKIKSKHELELELDAASIPEGHYYFFVIAEDLAGQRDINLLPGAITIQHQSSLNPIRKMECQKRGPWVAISYEVDPSIKGHLVLLKENENHTWSPFMSAISTVSNRLIFKGDENEVKRIQAFQFKLYTAADVAVATCQVKQDT